MITVAPEILRHVLTHLSLLLNRDALLDLFTTIKKTKASLTGEDQAIPEPGCHLYDGKLLDIDGQLYQVIGDTLITSGKGEPVTVVALGIPVTPQFTSRNSPIIIAPGDIANFQGDEAIATTMGRLLLNYTILVDPFNDLIPYINEEWKIGQIESNYIFDSLRSGKITVEQIKHYSRNLHYIGHFTELSVPTFTETSLTVDPRLIQRRDELLAEHKTEIAAGDTVVMNKIETELSSLDKSLLAGDESTLFYDQNPSRSYGIHRKTMMVMGGMVPEFGSKGFGFVEGSLEEGWDIKNFPLICNEIRRGSYNRAKETAKGGEETKFLIRVFQNTKVTEEDCKTTRYLRVNLTREMANKFLYRNIIVDGGLVMLTTDNLNTYVGHMVHMRSPLYCQTKDGYCYTCMGELFRAINQEVLTLAATNISGSFTLASLKSIHSVGAKRIEIKSLNSFVV